MKKTVVIATDTDIFNNNKMFDYDFGKNYFGVVAMHYFHKFLPEYQVITADIAIKMIDEKSLDAKDVMVIQEQDSKLGEALIAKGAFAHTVYCFESQIYARPFYQKLQSLPQKFKNRIFFNGMFEHTKDCDEAHNYHSYFPSYDDCEILEPLDWNKRDFVALVMGNKYIDHNNLFPRKIRFKKIVKWAVKKYADKDETDKYLSENELQNTRLEFVELFGSKGVLKLFGAGWDYVDNLPKSWEKRLKDIVFKLSPKPLHDKFVEISKCKFNLCIENLSYKGYVTEKIIHSFVAGSIPVYLGASNVEEFIPKNCFIDVRDFSDKEELFEFMKNLSQENALEYLKRGREFLNSDEGKKYSFKGYAKFLAELVKA